MARQYQQMEALTLIRHRCSCKQITFLVIKQKQSLLEKSLRNVFLAFYVSCSGLHTNKLTFDNYPAVRQLCKLRVKQFLAKYMPSIYNLPHLIKA